MIDYIRELYPDFSHVEDAKIELPSGQIIGWHSTLFNRTNLPLGSGAGSDKTVSKRVATAEAIEREVFRRKFSQSPRPLLLDEFPSSSGFAAGFEDQSTKLRAVCEAVERWGWSQWIDKKMHLEQCEIENDQLPPLAKYFRSYFEDAFYFRKKLHINIQGQDVHLQLGICIGRHGGGVFPGSRVCSLDEVPWEHSLTEAWRHLQISRNQTEADSTHDIFKKRVIFFSKNENQALDAISRATVKERWHLPKLRLLEPVVDLPPGVFVWRALCHDFIGWHLGPIDRFVY